MSDPWVVRAILGPPHGTAGAVRLTPTTDYPERVTGHDQVQLRGRDGSVAEWAVEWYRPHGAGWLLKLVGVDDRQAAEALRGSELVEHERDLPPLPDGEYYWHQLVGLPVETVAGEPLGTVREVLRTGSNDVWVTDRVLIPVLDQVIREVDLEAGRIVIEPLPGLLESCVSR